VSVGGVGVTPVLTSTYISPVESELMNKRSFESKARATGRKQSLGHFETSALIIISVVEVVLSDAATGDPFAKSIVDILYPIGLLRSLEIN